MLNFFDSFFKKDNDLKKMNFSLEIGPHTDLETLPSVKDVYVTMLPGGDYKETAQKSGDLVKNGFNHIPFSKEVVVDTDTPLALYLKLANKPFTYFLESVQGGEKWGRYSFIGLAAETVIKVYNYEVRVEKNGKLIEKNHVNDPLAWIEEYQNTFKVPELENLPDFNGGLVGYFGYEIIRYIEPKLENIDKIDELNVPDILLMVSNDHIK